MIINSISLRNFKSYGNNLQKLVFSRDGSLILLTGQNGNGKCLSGDTVVDIEIFDDVTLRNLKNFLVEKYNNENIIS
jgi:hypothetical protein